MNRIAKFEKVSIGQFTAAWKDTFQEQSEEKICEIYGALKLPQRATAGSAGRDDQNSYRSACMDGAGLGTEMLSEKRSWIQVQITVEQYRRNY